MKDVNIEEADLITVETIDKAKEKERMSDVEALCNSVNIKIQSQQDYDFTAEALKKIKSRYKELETKRKEITTPLDNAKKSIMDLFRSPLELLEKAEAYAKRLMITYTDEQEKIARAEQKRLQDLADAETAKQKKILDEKIARAEASGKTEKVEALQEKKETITPIVAPVVTPKIETPKGVSYRDKWTAKVVDFSKLPDSYKLPNQSMLDKHAQNTKGAIMIPGVEFVSEKILASR